MPILTHPAYRPDIDGLRGIAVLSVLIYHAFPNIFPGGFIGVDVFFIISGFLISTIIFDSLSQNRFSFKEFYARRIKRIFPALITILCFCFVCGWFLLLAADFRQLCWHIFSGALFFSNFRLWGETGYFDNIAETKPLLHLWSLGIEEQFYIIWPFLLWGLWKLKKSKSLFLIAITIFGFISFYLNIFYLHKSPETSFYLPQMRFWELLIGAFLAYLNLYACQIQKKIVLNFQSIVGVILLILGFSLINQKSSFPGYWALLPTLGTFFLISASQMAWINQKILAHKSLVWFGVISYPLYLWHWPLLSLANITYGTPVHPVLRLFLVFLAIPLAWFTYRYIERPFRSHKIQIQNASKFFSYTQKNAVTVLSVSMISIGVLGIYSFGQKGFKFRLKDREEFASYFNHGAPEWRVLENLNVFEAQRFDCNFCDLEKMRRKKATSIPKDHIDPSCYTHNPSKKTVLLWGDSHAAQLYSGLKEVMPDDWEILIITGSGCAPNPYQSMDSKEDFCVRANWFAVKKIETIQPDVVIVAQNIGHKIESMKAIEDKLNALKVKRILFMGPVPHWTLDLHKILVKKPFWKKDIRRTTKFLNKEILENNKLIKSNFHSQKSEYVDLIDFFCSEDGCLTYIGDDKKSGITAYDDAHLTPAASAYLARNFLKNIILQSDVSE